MNKTSAGWCLRDYTANFIVADTSWKEGNCSIVEGEVNNLRQVENQGITHVIFETDSKSVVDAMQSTIQVAVSRNIVRLSVILRMYLIVIQILW
jgi:ribonuclease HI